MTSNKDDPYYGREWMRPINEDDDWEVFVPGATPDEEPIKEHPATAKRRRAREFSRKWGWLYDFGRALQEYLATLWTPELALGVGKALFSLALVVVFAAIAYVVYFSDSKVKPRQLPSVNHLMEDAREKSSDDGSPSPSRTSDHTIKD